MRRFAQLALAAGLSGLVLAGGVWASASPAAADDPCYPVPGNPTDHQGIPGDGGTHNPICGNDPVGHFESAQLINHGRQVEVKGWTIDPNTADPIAVRITVGAKVYRVDANVNRPDLAGFLAYGTKHGFHAILTVPSSGAAHVWATALNVDAGKDTKFSTKNL
ncbi:hypothetical protein [Fodinicola feengrottensis]